MFNHQAVISQDYQVNGREVIVQASNNSAQLTLWVETEPDSQAFRRLRSRLRSGPQHRVHGCPETDEGDALKAELESWLNHNRETLLNGRH